MFKLILTLFLISTVAISQFFPKSRNAIKIIDAQTPILEKKLAKQNLALGNHVFIRIFKQEGELEVWIKEQESFHLFNTYPICTYGFGGLGPKLREGDGMAPEGFYFVKANQLNPYSSYHLSFNLGYPNKYDRAHKRTGSALMVHGDCVSVGCYAMKDDKIEEIYTIVNSALLNQQKFFRVHIFPFRMTDENLKKHKDFKWYEFWKNLKQGYDYFENNNNPPNVEVKNLKYTFN